MHFDSAYKICQEYLQGTSEVTPAGLIHDISHGSFDIDNSSRNIETRNVDLLCQISSSRQNSEIRKTALAALYKNIIEKLCDDFSSRGVDICNKILLRMISYIRKTDEGIHFDRQLTELGYFDEQQLLDRYRKIRKTPPLTLNQKKNIRKIIVLSRVTVGADVAITSVIIHRLAAYFPSAELIIAGPSHLPEILYNLPSVYWTKFYYDRDGGLLGRLTAWSALYKLVKKEWQGFSPEQVLLVDPDSRLSQLGLLPMVPDSSYAYLNSRDDQVEDLRISEITNLWLNNLLGEEKQQRPEISIRTVHLQNIKKFLQQFAKSIRIIVMNFGVGNDAKKRLPDPFEQKLLLHLFNQHDILVILDSGCHPHERQRARELMHQMKANGVAATAVTEKDINNKNISFQNGLVCFQGGIGSLSAFIDQADLFFGYDSCCQHLATACNTPSVICFAGAPNDRFFCRWRPLDISGSTTTIHIPAGQLSDQDVKNKALEFSVLIKEKLKA